MPPTCVRLAQRLARRCWPGPVTLVVDDSHPESLVRQLPPKVQQAVSPQQTIGLRVPGHPVILDVLRMLAGPLALTSANRAGMPEAVTAKEVIDAFGDELDLVVDDGPCRFGQPSSVVRVSDGRVRDAAGGRRARANPAAALQPDGAVRLHGQHLPQPDGRNALPRHARQAAGLQDRRIGGPRRAGDVGRHCGHVGRTGQPARPCRSMADMGLDLSGHETQPLTEPLVRHADVIYTMTRSHREAIVAQWPSAAERTWLLSADGADICDPIGGPVERYRRCAAEIQAELKTRVNELR